MTSLPSTEVQSVQSSWLRLRNPLAAPTGWILRVGFGAMLDVGTVLKMGQNTSNWHLKCTNLNGK